MMEKFYQYIATALILILSLVCFIAPFSWWTWGILLASAFPFSTVLVNIQLEIAWVLAAFVFSVFAFSGYAVEILVAYSVYFVIPIMLFRHQKTFVNEIPNEFFLKFLSYILMLTTFFVGLWWQDVISQVSVPVLLKIWPGALGLIGGSIIGVFFLTDTSMVKKIASVTMFNYWLLIVFLVLVVVLEDAHVLFCNMVLGAFLPFVLDGWSLLRKFWEKRSKSIFCIAGCCATISAVPLFILGLYSIFKPWIVTLLNQKE